VTNPTGEYAVQRRERLIDAVNDYLLSDDVTIEEMADVIHQEIQQSLEYHEMMALRASQSMSTLTTSEKKKIHLAYQRTDTKQYHEFNFSDWYAALEFARMVDRSNETQLLSLKIAS
jgi:hypothetical protein